MPGLIPNGSSITIRQLLKTWGHRGDFAGYTAVAVNSPDGRKQVVVLFNTMFEDEEGEKALQRLISTAYCD